MEVHGGTGGYPGYMGVSWGYRRYMDIQGLWNMEVHGGTGGTLDTWRYMEIQGLWIHGVLVGCGYMGQNSDLSYYKVTTKITAFRV